MGVLDEIDTKATSNRSGSLLRTEEVAHCADRGRGKGKGGSKTAMAAVVLAQTPQEWGVMF